MSDCGHDTHSCDAAFMARERDAWKERAEAALAEVERMRKETVTMNGAWDSCAAAWRSERTLADRLAVELAAERALSDRLAEALSVAQWGDQLSCPRCRNCDPRGPAEGEGHDENCLVGCALDAHAAARRETP